MVSSDEGDMTTGGGDLHELHWETRQVYLALHLYSRTVSDQLFFLREFASGDFPELLIFKLWGVFSEGFPRGSAGKESTCNAGDLSSILGLRTSPGVGTGYPLQYFCFLFWLSW